MNYQPLSDGGPAFPTTYDCDASLGGKKGMTLRDYFAAAALQGLLANDPSCGKDTDYAKDAYVFADAMLAERKEASRE